MADIKNITINGDSSEANVSKVEPMLVPETDTIEAEMESILLQDNEKG